MAHHKRGVLLSEVTKTNIEEKKCQILPESLLSFGSSTVATSTATGSDDHVFYVCDGDNDDDDDDDEPDRRIPPLGQKARGAGPSACQAPVVWPSAPPALMR